MKTATIRLSMPGYIFFKSSKGVSITYRTMTISPITRKMSKPTMQLLVQLRVNYQDGMTELWLSERPEAQEITERPPCLNFHQDQHHLNLWVAIWALKSMETMPMLSSCLDSECQLLAFSSTSHRTTVCTRTSV